MQTLWQDLRYGFRTLTRKPGFTVVAIIALALGIGANTAIFSVVNSILLRPLAYHDSERLVVINHDYRKLDLKASVSAAGYTYYRDNAKSFESVAAATVASFNLTGGGDPERLNGSPVTHNFFSALGATPPLGRVFLPEEDQPGKNKVVVLSHGFWQRRFGGDPGIVNKNITLNDESYTVVGVMPRSFQFGREVGQVVDLWTPIAFTPQQLNMDNLTNENLFVFARLKPGVSIQQAQAELDTIAATLRQQYLPWAPTRSEWGLTTESFRELVVGDIRRALWILMGIVGLVLLIACANVANLLLARAADRQKEMAMSLSLPSTKYREPAQRANFYQELLQRIRALPGVQSAGATSILPLSGNNSSGSFRIEGREVPQGQSSPHGDRWAATTDYFSTMKIPIIRGRFFDDRDTMESQPVAIIDETMQRKYWEI